MYYLYFDILSISMVGVLLILWYTKYFDGVCIIDTLSTNCFGGLRIIDTLVY